MNENYTAPERMYMVKAGAYYLTKGEFGAAQWNRKCRNVILFHEMQEARDLLASLNSNGMIVPLLHSCVATYELVYETANEAVIMLNSNIGVGKGWIEVNNFLVFTPQNVEGIDKFLDIGGVICLPRLNFELAFYVKFYQ